MKIFFLILILLSVFLLPQLALGQAACIPGAADSTNVCNPFGGTGTADIKGLAFKIINAYTFITAFLTIVMLVFSGLLMVVSQGNEQGIRRAKIAFNWTIYGFILTLLSYVLISGMLAILQVETLPDPSGVQAPEVVNPFGLDDQLMSVVTKLLNGFLAVAGIVAVLILVFDGFRYITAGGNEEQATQAKNGLKWVVAGLVTMLLAYVIVRATATLVGG
jgi:hypothetical protein